MWDLHLDPFFQWSVTEARLLIKDMIRQPQGLSPDHSGFLRQANHTRPRNSPSGCQTIVPPGLCLIRLLCTAQGCSAVGWEQQRTFTEWPNSGLLEWMVLYIRLPITQEMCLLPLRATEKCLTGRNKLEFLHFVVVPLTKDPVH